MTKQEKETTMIQTAHTGRQAKLLFALLSGIILTALSLTAVAQTAPAEQPAPQATIKVETLTAAASAQEAPPADYVSIHVDGGTLRQVLNAFSMQTQRNVVIGPEVVSEGVSIHLNNVRWDEALDVILKPYGFGYRKVGDTVVVSKLDKLASLSAVEPLETKVFNLKYLDASDVQDIIKAQLSSRGTISVASARGQKGWKFATQSDAKSSESAVMLGKLERVADDKDDQQDRSRSKTLIVTDVPGSLARVADVLAEVDKIPRQVLVESRFMEVNNTLLKEVGLQLDPISLKLDIVNLGQAGSGGDESFNQTGWKSTLSAAAIIDLLQKDEDTKVLSAPRILTLNNQEATIVVGQKFPIVKTEIQNNTGNDNPTKSTELERYENSGIQLSVVPQICDGNFINMIVHPSVVNFVGFEVVRNDDGTDLVRYPIINTRETETQIMTKNGETIVIGGLLEDQKKEGVRKVPLLGDIPLLGRMFRRNTSDNYTKDLLIFISATIVNEKNYDTIVAKEGQAEMSGEPAVKEIYDTLQVSPAAGEAVPAGTM
jgi:type II secretory pathway component GspD/PulD (secretin)